MSSHAGGCPRLLVFDVDGTLVDSQATIVACVQAAFRAEGLVPPRAEAIRRIVGLSLVEAVLALMDEPDPAAAPRLAEHYKAAFLEHRARPDFQEPLFPGARAILDDLLERGFVLGIATGKAMRGLRFVLERHGLERHFTTLQTADLHPSKPHPAMLLAAMQESGISAAETMLIGDTTYDILMARAVGAMPVGVAWGNHAAEELAEAGAAVVLRRYDELYGLLP
ncbi:MAG: HAD-IA family hydrolase [Geminicoccaceae bacterium]